MQIAIEGIRSSVSDWKAAQSMPADQLPALTPAQQETARSLGIPEVDYARSALAASRTSEKLLQKTERFARWLQGTLHDKGVASEIRAVVLNTWDEKFEVTIDVGGATLFFKVDETVVDSFFEGGAREAQENLGRIIDLALSPGVQR